MASNPTPASGEAEVCGDCGLPKATTRPAIREANGELCGAHLAGQNCGYVLPAVDLYMACRERTIARLRSQLEQRAGRIAKLREALALIALCNKIESVRKGITIALDADALSAAETGETKP